MNCRVTLSLGAYVLGALEPRERAEVEQHLLGCSGCRDELVRLAPLPGLLRQVSLDDLSDASDDPAAALLPPAHPPAVHGTDRGRARRLRGWGAVAAAAVAGVAVGTAAGAGASRGLTGPAGPPPRTPTATTWSGADPTTHVRATAALVPRAWGTEIHLQLRGLPPGERCRLVLRSRDGRTEVDGAWSTAYAARADVPAATALAPTDIAGLDVVTADRRLLVRLPKPPSRGGPE